jgi:hypothetical protein
MRKSANTLTTNQLDQPIREIREHKVMLDFDLAKVYGVETKSLNRAVKRNPDRFPSDFVFQLTRQVFEPHQGEVAIETLGVLPVNPFNNVQYFAPGGLVTGVQFNQPAFSDISFDSVISTDSLQLGPIAPTAPSASNNSLQSGVFGPNGLFVSGEVATFSAVIVPEASSAALFLTSALVMLGLLRRRTKGRHPSTGWRAIRESDFVPGPYKSPAT